MAVSARRWAQPPGHWGLHQHVLRMEAESYSFPVEQSGSSGRSLLKRLVLSSEPVTLGHGKPTRPASGDCSVRGIARLGPRKCRVRALCRCFRTRTSEHHSLDVARVGVSISFSANAGRPIKVTRGGKLPARFFGGRSRKSGRSFTHKYSSDLWSVFIDQADVRNHVAMVAD